MKFNIDNNVKVKLTEYGKDILREQHNSLYKTINVKKEFKLPPEDDNGYSEWQLWNLMATFGDWINFGTVLTPFELEILINV